MSDKYSNILSTAHIKNNLKGHSVKGGMNTMLSQVGKMILQTVSIVVLARMLTPDDYGIFGMVFSIVAFAFIFKDLGLSVATIQKENISHEQVSTLFWINTFIGVVVGILVMASAPLLAWFYGDARVLNITLCIAMAFPLSGLTVQHQALLQRQMHFGKLAMVELISAFLSMLTGILCAWQGLHYWALVWMQIAGIFYTAIGVWLACRWIPSWISRETEVRSLLKFGAGVTGFSIFNYFSRNADKVIIGKFCGSVALGLYSTAYKLLLFPINNIRAPILNVVIPALSTLQSEPEKYRLVYKKAVTLLALVSMPLVMFLLCCSEEVICIILGTQWLPAAKIFRILGVVAFIQPVIAIGRGAVMVSMGFGKKYFRFGFINSVVTVLSFFIGLYWGVVGVALAYLISFYLVMIVTLPWCLQDSPVRTRDFWGSIWAIICSSLFMGLVMIFTKDLIINSGWFGYNITLKAIIISIFCVITGGICFVLGLVMTTKGRDNLALSIGIIRSLLKYKE